MRREKHSFRDTRSTQFSPHDIISILNALREIDGDDMIPIALYLCCQLELRFLLTGHRRSDGSVAKLSNEDIELCLNLREDMVKESARMAMKLFAEAPDPSCRCHAVINEIYIDIVNGNYEDIPRTNPLGPYWRGHIDLEEMGSPQRHRRICSGCARSLRQRELKQRRELWDELPRLVGFWESWLATRGRI